MNTFHHFSICDNCNDLIGEISEEEYHVPFIECDRILQGHNKPIHCIGRRQSMCLTLAMFKQLLGMTDYKCAFREDQRMRLKDLFEERVTSPHKSIKFTSLGLVVRASAEDALLTISTNSPGVLSELGRLLYKDSFYDLYDWPLVARINTGSNTGVIETKEERIHECVPGAEFDSFIVVPNKNATLDYSGKKTDIFYIHYTGKDPVKIKLLEKFPGFDRKKYLEHSFLTVLTYTNTIIRALYLISERRRKGAMVEYKDPKDILDCYNRSMSTGFYQIQSNWDDDLGEIE